MKEGRTFLSSKRVLISFVLAGLLTIINIRREVEHGLPAKELYFSPLAKRYSEFREERGRGSRYLNSRVLYTVNGTSSFQFNRIIICGDVHPQP